MKVKNGDIVLVDYVGRLTNQVIFDSTDNRGPMQVEVGKGELIPKFEESILGMEAGEQKTINVDHEEAYGEYMEELFFEVEKDKFPENMQLEIGMPLQFVQEDNQVVMFKVKEIMEYSVMIDANHPLAGQDLIFDIKLVEIKNSPKILI